MTALEIHTQFIDFIKELPDLTSCSIKITPDDFFVTNINNSKLNLYANSDTLSFKTKEDFLSTLMLIGLKQSQVSMLVKKIQELHQKMRVQIENSHGISYADLSLYLYKSEYNKPKQ